jgi:hypothetical protein
VSRATNRAARYIAAGRSVRDHRGAELVPAKVAISARRKTVVLLLGLVNDQTGIGVRGRKS